MEVGAWWCFFLVSLIETFIRYPSLPFFGPSCAIWKAKTPPQLRELAWIIAHGMLNACDLVQRRSPSWCLSLHQCVMCKVDAETADRVFLRCLVAMFMWHRLFMEANVSWAASASCRTLLCERFTFFGRKKKGLALGGCVMMAIFWVVWMERNKINFEGARVRRWTVYGIVCVIWLHCEHPFNWNSVIVLYMLCCWIGKLL